jgi:hypothetical protein
VLVVCSHLGGHESPFFLHVGGGVLMSKAWFLLVKLANLTASWVHCRIEGAKTS